MWVLESSGDILKGKRMWLKPGKKYLFGRVKKDEVRFAIDHKTVSRKHFIINVSEVAEGEVSKVFARTRCTIIDRESKSGTTVNDTLLKGKENQAKVLDREENSVRPGSLDEILLIRWVPCVLTFYLLKKELKAGALAIKQKRAMQLGVKAMNDFLPDQTTHLVAAKRNTPKGLQALITGKYLVNEAFLDALEVAATPTTLSQEENVSPLEEDFDAAWPSEENYLPPQGKEPTIKPPEAYKPRTDRSNIFEDYTFVFADQTQYELLLPVVTIGHGKALRMTVDNGKTTVDDVVMFMQNAAGRKTFGALGDGAEGGGVVLVRWTAPDPHSDWANHLIAQASLKLDQRAVDQSEFLDAILANDASQLRQSIPQESFVDGIRAPPPSFAPGRGATQVQTQGTVQAPAQKIIRAETNGHATPEPEVAPASRQPSRRSENVALVQTQAVDDVQPEQPAAATSQALSQDSIPQSATSQATIGKSRYRAAVVIQKFDDDFNPDDIMASDGEDEEESSQVSVVEASDVEDAPEPTTTPAPAPAVQQPQRKRQRSPEPYDGDVMDDLLPAANAMKRQRREWEQDARKTGEPLHKPTEHVAVAKKPKKTLDVREAIKLQKEREEERAKRPGSESPPPSPVNDKQPANLAVIEYIDLPVRKRSSRSGNNPEDDPRWDERWNGLKNFKKFRPQEKGLVRKSNHAAKVFVPLVTAAKKTGGLGDRYWDKPEEEREQERRRKKKRDKQRALESLSQSEPQSGDVDDDEDVRDEDVEEVSPATYRLQEEAAAIVDHEIDVDSPRRTRADDSRQTQSTNQRTTQPSSSTQSTRGTKRKAAPNGTATSKKKQKTLPVITVDDDDDEDDDDDNKFKFGRGKGRRGKA